MIQQELLHGWGIWFTYQSEPNQYGQNLVLVYQLKTVADLVYLWNNSPICSVNNYFLRQDATQQCYSIDEKWKKINSIEMFKQGIQPKWEDPNNQIGALLVFSIPKDYVKKQQLYQGLVFYFIGQNFENSDFVNGIRFISSKAPDNCYRVQIWVRFNSENIEALTSYQQTLNTLFELYELKIEHIQFINIKDKINKNDKNEKSK